MQNQTDIAIVGGGAIGCALACTLAQANPDLHITLLESAPDLPAVTGQRFDARVYALSSASITFLQSLTLWQQIADARACPYKRMHVWDGESNGAIEFDCEQLHADQLGYIVEHSVLLNALRQRMAAFANVHFLAPCKVVALEGLTSNKGSRLQLEDGRYVEARIVVGADGAQSVVRRLAGFQVRTWGYGQSALVTTVTTSLPHRCTAWQRFGEHGALAFLPLSEGGEPEGSQYSSIVWSLDDEVAGRYMAMPEAQFLSELERAFESRLGTVTSAEARHLIPLQQMHAVKYTLPGVALVGDAAHTIHPLAGQGINLGFYDVQVLGREIARAVRRGIPLEDESILKRYARQRQAHNLGAMAAMEGFKHLFSAKQGWLVALRSGGLQWTARQAWLKRWFMQIAAGPDLG